MITSNQKLKISQVFNVFETGSKKGKYDLLVYPDGKNNSRQITFGRSQTTEQGNLKALLQLYVTKNGKFTENFKTFITDLGKKPMYDKTELNNINGLDKRILYPSYFKLAMNYENYINNK